MYVNFENGSHFIGSLNFDNPELTVFIAFKITDIASENQSFFNSKIGNTTGRITTKLRTFLQNAQRFRFIDFKSTGWCLRSNSK